MEASINSTLYSSSLWSQLKCQEAFYHFSAFLLQVERAVIVIFLAKDWKCELMMLHNWELALGKKSWTTFVSHSPAGVALAAAEGRCYETFCLVLG